MKNGTLKERLLLEEPEDGEPEDGTRLRDEAPEDEQADVLSTLSGAISAEISRTYDDIDSLTGLMSTIREAAPGRDDILGILDSVADDRTIHVGMLQQAYDALSGRGELIDDGKEKASGIAGGDEPEETEEGE